MCILNVFIYHFFFTFCLINLMYQTNIHPHLYKGIPCKNVLKDYFLLIHEYTYPCIILNFSTHMECSLEFRTQFFTIYIFQIHPYYLTTSHKISDQIITDPHQILQRTLGVFICNSTSADTSRSSDTAFCRLSKLKL